jgi:TetR/AcrR family fatty acid metabolism transcriptional regulator
MTGTNSKTRRQRLEEKESAIISAAHEEFVENGFEGAKIAGIARRAGVAEGTLYLYFRNKSALLGAVVGAFYERLTAGAREGVAAREATDERLAFLATHHLESCLAEWSILSLAMPVLYQAGSYRSSEYFGFNRSYVAVFDHVVREGMARGEIRDDMPLHLMRDLFYGTLEHSVRTVMVRGQGVPPKPAIAEMSSQVMALVRSAYGLEPGPGNGGSAPDLRRIAQRLEAAARRLEQAAR